MAVALPNTARISSTEIVETITAQRATPRRAVSRVSDDAHGNKVGPTGSGIDERLLHNLRPAARRTTMARTTSRGFLAQPGGDPDVHHVICPDSPRLDHHTHRQLWTDVPMKKVTIEGWSLRLSVRIQLCRRCAIAPRCQGTLGGADRDRGCRLLAGIGLPQRLEPGFGGITIRRLVE